MTRTSKALRITGILILTLAGLMAIWVAHVWYVSSMVPLSILGDGKVYVEGWDRGFVSAKGTWTIDGHRHASPLNMSHIRCIRAESFCYVAEARVTNRYLIADMDLYEIKRWDNATLEFATDTHCVTYSYVVNRSTEKLTGRRLKKPNADQVCPPVIEEDLKLSFVNGLQVVEELEARHSPTGWSTAASIAWIVFMLTWALRIARRAAPSHGSRADQLTAHHF